MKKADDHIPNHTFEGRTVVLTGNVAADVTSLRRQGVNLKPNYPTTYQQVRNASLIVSYDGSRFKVSTCVSHDLDLEPVDEAKSLEVVFSLPPVLREWLLDAKSMKHSNYLPIGFGWDGKFTRREYAKRRALAIMFAPIAEGGVSHLDQEWLDDLLDDLCRTPAVLLLNSWGDVHTVKRANLPACEPLVTRELVTFHTDGSVRSYKQRKVVGNLTKHPGHTLPTDVERVIILDRNLFATAEGESYGTSMSALIYKEDAHGSPTVKR